MAPEPDPAPLPPTPACSPRAHGQEHQCPETFGAVTVERYVKDDGRTLILYSHVAQDEPGAARS